MFDCPHETQGRGRKALAEAGLREMRYDFDMHGLKVLTNF